MHHVNPRILQPIIISRRYGTGHVLAVKVAVAFGTMAATSLYAMEKPAIAATTLLEKKKPVRSSKAATRSTTLQQGKSVARSQPIPTPPAHAGKPYRAADAETISVLSASRSHRQATARQSDPVAVTTLTSHDITEHQIANLQSAVKYIPAVTMQISNPRNVAINIRGLGNFSASAQDGIRNGVALYLDGVYQAMVGQSISDIVDLDGIEVLKGPQGTRGGVDNNAGVINITTRMPSFKREYSAEVLYGSYNSTSVKLHASGAIGNSDKVAYSLAALFRRQDGYVHNVTNGRDYQGYNTKGIRGQILAVPTERLRIRLIADYTHTHESCCVSVYNGLVSSYSNGAPINNSLPVRLGRLGLPMPPAHSTRDLLTNTVGGQSVDQEVYGVSLDLRYTFSNNWVLSSLASWRTWFWYPHNASGDFGADTYSASNNQVYEQNATEEVKISSPENRNFKFEGGVFYMWQEVPDYINDTYSKDAGVFYGNPTTARQRYVDTLALNGYSYWAYDEPVTNTVSVYGRTTWHATSKLDVIAGLRYSNTTVFGSRRAWQTGQSLAGLTAAEQAAAQTLRNSLRGGPQSFSAHTNESHPSGALTLNYKITPRNLLYVSYARGIRNGGINPNNLPSGASAIVKPELLDDVEVGLKNVFFHDRVLLNLAAFWEDDHNYISQGYVYTQNAQISYLTNAKEVISRGFEADARGQIIAGLEGRLSAAYTDAYYASFHNATKAYENSYPGAPTTADLTGSQISLNSKWNLSAGLEYTTHVDHILPDSRLSRATDFYVGMDYSWRSNYNSEPTNSRYSVIKAYGLLDAHLGVRARSGRWDLGFWGHNVTDQRYFITRSASSAGGVISGQPGDPAMFGGTFRINY
ncbi:TonB-dependent receptor [Gluconacetobacter liquefaciens]|uniref:Iron complex outermembrane receptor protein n=1 Tax=Gluconacetobacter liquefaciens TaxID=89584 RepID=A0A370FYP7_GLULI|nr:TonB-dependent receptor [Gluconacetobacter liquefaciens]MBB2187873.1 TonB-dependent receptor [Gluconacetobacter liquefaciens]RDI34242.1 iron complex outermembrane receptor protein [Gluconacetobacter liquefaciens]GBQ95387.1 TonB-dependent receptor [Gluconacetobacter liquefaciens NRIC 0522]GEB38794.1 TonB-dependent receptor [Gluconacetobacter liquefaciens]